MSDTSPNRYHRHLRLRGYDYSQAGAYFITICTHRRACLFGAIEREAISLNDAGVAVQRVWASLPERFGHVETDALAVMPNHLHGIIVISGGANDTVPLSGIVGAFKSLSTREYANCVRSLGWAPFHGRLWQPNYYEHVIRNEVSLNQVRRYIQDNPRRWRTDQENPNREFDVR